MDPFHGEMIAQSSKNLPAQKLTPDAFLRQLDFPVRIRFCFILRLFPNTSVTKIHT
jgi:hypothetical protein